jgi:hypothetical protein
MFAWYKDGYFHDDLEISYFENAMYFPLKVIIGQSNYYKPESLILPDPEYQQYPQDQYYHQPMH